MIPFSNSISHLIGFLIPAYASYKALKHKSHDKKWLKYWTVFSMMKVAEMLLVPHLWSPYYYDMRLILLLWMQSTSLGGSDFIYNKLIQPFIDKYESAIDQHIENFRNNALLVIQEKGSIVADYALKFWHREDVQRTVRTAMISVVSFITSSPKDQVAHTSATIAVEQVSEVIYENASASAPTTTTDVNQAEEESEQAVRRRVPQIRKAFEEIKPSSPVLNRSLAENRKQSSPLYERKKDL